MFFLKYPVIMGFIPKTSKAEVNQILELADKHAIIFLKRQELNFP